MAKNASTYSRTPFKYWSHEDDYRAYSPFTIVGPASLLVTALGPAPVEGYASVVLPPNAAKLAAGAVAPYNDYFDTEDEARFSHACWQLALYGEIRRPWPGERPPTLMRGLSKGKGSLFQRLREVDLSEFAGRYTTLAKVGPGRWKGRCPIHAGGNERTPSFYVYGPPWRWRCFGRCASGGDITDLAHELRFRQRETA